VDANGAEFSLAAGFVVDLVEGSILRDSLFNVMADRRGVFLL